MDDLLKEVRQCRAMRESGRRQALGWVLPTIALVVAALYASACVAAYMHTAPIDAAYQASGQSGLGVLRARPAGVMAADQTLGFTWIFALPAAVAATLLAISAVNRFHAEGAALVFAQLMTLVGIATCLAGVVLAALGALELVQV